MKNDRDAGELLAAIAKRAYKSLPPSRSSYKRKDAMFARSMASLIMKKARSTGDEPVDLATFAATIEARLKGLRDVQDLLKVARGPKEMLHESHLVDAVPVGEGPPVSQTPLSLLDDPKTFIVRSDEIFDMVAFDGWTPKERTEEDYVVIDALVIDETMHVTFHAVSDFILGIRRIRMKFGEGGIGSWPADYDPRPLYRKFLQVVDIALLDDESEEPQQEETDEDVGDPFVEIAEEALASPACSASIGRMCARHPLLASLYQETRPIIEQGNLETRDFFDDGVPEGMVDHFSIRYFLWRLNKVAPAMRRSFNRAGPTARQQMKDTIGTRLSRPAYQRMGVYSAAARMLLHIRNAMEEGRASYDEYRNATREGDPDITGHRCEAGIIVIKDRALFEMASVGQVIPTRTRREVPIIVLYQREGADYRALVVQMDAGEINLADWRTISVEAADTDDALTWYLRDLIAVSDTAEVLPATPVEAIEAVEVAPDVVVVDVTAPISNDAMPVVDPTLPEPADEQEAAEIRLDLGDEIEAPPAIGRAATLPLRPVCRVIVTPDNHGQARSVIDRWFDTRGRQMGAAIVEERRGEGAWVLTQRSDMTEDADLWTVSVTTDGNRIDVTVSTTTEGHVTPRLPRLLRELAEFPGIKGLDGPLSHKAIPIVTRSRLASFMRRATDPDRTLPILLMSSDDNGRHLADPDRVAAQAIGAMHVYSIAPSLTRQLSEAWGRGLAAHSGAARLYQPDFDPAVDSSFRHPLYLPGVGSDDQIDRLVNRETEATLRRYDQATSGHADLDSLGASDAPSATDQQQSPEDQEQSVGVEEPVPDDDSAQLALPEMLPEIDDVVALPAEADDETTVMEQAEEVLQPALPAEAPGAVADHGAIERMFGMILARMDRFEAQLAHSAAPAAANDDLAAAAQIASLRNELAVERRNASELLAIAEEERDEAMNEREKLRNALEALRRTSPASSMGTQPYPDSLADLEPWADQHLVGRVVILPRAYRAMRRVKYKDMERLCRTLELLSGPYIDMKQGVAGAKDAWEEGLKQLRLDIKKQSLNGASANEGEYYFRYQGEKLLLDRHIRGVEKRHNDEAHLLRIYFHYHSDPRTGAGRVLIGHMPTHLTTSDS